MDSWRGRTRHKPIKLWYVHPGHQELHPTFANSPLLRLSDNPMSTSKNLNDRPTGNAPDYSRAFSPHETPYRLGGNVGWVRILFFGVLLIYAI